MRATIRCLPLRSFLRLRSLRSFLVQAFTVLACTVPATAAPPPVPAPARADVVHPPDAIVTRNVPPIAQQDVEPLLPYENIRAASLADWHPRERRLLILTRFAQAAQLHEVAMPGGDRAQLTFYGEPVVGGRYRPSDPRQIVFSLNRGGAENYQLYLLDRASGKPVQQSDRLGNRLRPLLSLGPSKLRGYVDVNSIRRRQFAGSHAV